MQIQKSDNFIDPIISIIMTQANTYYIHVGTSMQAATLNLNTRRGNATFHTSEGMLGNLKKASLFA